MYAFYPIQDMITGAERAAAKPVERYGVEVYVDTDPDFIAPDFAIDPADIKGIEIFRSFCLQMAEHYKTLKNKS